MSAKCHKSASEAVRRLQLGLQTCGSAGARCILARRGFTQLAVGARQEKDTIVTSDLSKRAEVV